MLSSGTMMWFYVLGAAKCFILLLLVSLCVFYKKKQYVTYSHVLFYCSFFTIYSLLNLYVINHDTIKENLCVGYIVTAFSTYIIMGSRNLFDFRDKLTKVLAIINAWGLIVYNLYELGVMDMFSVVRPFPNGVYTMCLGVSIGWPHPFERYAGIWHEPGAGQISSMFVLLLHFREIVLWKWRDNKQKICVLILLLAILFSKSSTAYLLLMCFVVFIALYSGGDKINKFNLFLKIALLVIGIVMAIAIFNSEIIQEKLFNPDSISKNARTVENLTLLNIFLDNPIFGVGLGTSNQWYDLDRFGAAGCSNGLLFYTSGLGTVWLVSFFVCLILSACKLRHIVPIPLVLIIYLVEICSQRFMEMPITFLFLFSFGSYRLPLYLMDKVGIKQIVLKNISKKNLVKIDNL